MLFLQSTLTSPVPLRAHKLGTHFVVVVKKTRLLQEYTTFNWFLSANPSLDIALGLTGYRKGTTETKQDKDIIDVRIILVG